MRRLVLVAALVSTLAACGGSDGGGSEPQVIDPATALGLSGGTRVIVRGYYARDPGAILPRMCTALAESYPPTCGMPSLPVSNFSEEAEKELPLQRDPETGGRWSESEVEISGRIEEGALVVD